MRSIEETFQFNKHCSVLCETKRNESREIIVWSICVYVQGGTHIYLCICYVCKINPFGDYSVLYFEMKTVIRYKKMKI